ncbi:MAG: hypothetical protein JOZ47_06995 [Kutzneria sp.]|nr:hypothetical protein [Kutzneria sp.]
MDTNTAHLSTSANAVVPTVRWAWGLALAALLLMLLGPLTELLQLLVRDVPAGVAESYREAMPGIRPEIIKATVVFDQLPVQVISLIFVAVVLFVARKMRQGRGWARFATSALLFIGAVFSRTGALGSPLDAMVEIAIAALAIAAVVCIFVPASRPHFSRAA